jgi:F-type H+-transporting ATPase subunit b
VLAEQEQLRSEASSIREEARAEGATILAELKEQAAREAERLVESGKTTLLSERDAASRALKAEIGALALELASRIVGEKLQDDKVANKVVDDFIAELEGKKVS